MRTISLLAQESEMGTNSVISYVIARTAAETGHIREGQRLIAALDPDMSRCADSSTLREGARSQEI